MDRFCRGCLVRFDEPTELLQYTEKNRRLFVYSTGIQVKRTDTFTFQLCKDCYLNMKAACNFKKQCRSSDKRFKSYLGLKENGENVDLSTFLKNSDESWSFRFPGNSTPAYQRVKDDDNESTTTSIRNFMMDMMPDDDLPDTEARIIKEVIDEEADVLEDSLDSHWLQDDASIDTDFRLDFSFSPFSTPRPVNNDRYTPNKSVSKATEKTKESKQIQAVTKKVLDNLDMPLIDDGSNQSFAPLTEERDESNHSLINTIEKERDNKFSDVPIKVERNFDETMDSLDVVNEFLKYETENANQIDVDRNLEQAVENIDNDVEPATQRSLDRNSEEAMEDIDNKAKPTGQCTIDRNLEEALKNTANKEFSLDELLVSPQVTPGLQSPPTPLIDNILFGEKLDIDENSNRSQKYKAGRCIETYENVTGDVEMSGEFTTTEIKMEMDIDLEEIKNEMIDEIDRHANQENDEPNLCCNVCQKKFNDVEKLQRHSKRHQVLEELIIEIVDENDTNEENNQFDITNFYCNMCQKKFKNLSMLKRHAKRHQTKNEPRPRKIWICDYCAKECNDRTNFLRHLQTHLRTPKKYQCKLCNLEFCTENAYKQHKRTHKGKKQVLKPAKKRFVCTECGMSTDKCSNFKIHLKRHEKTYTHVCPECDKGFFRRTELTIHMRYHTGEKPFPCPYCYMRFVRRDSLSRHIKRHLDLRPFQCDYCQTRFINSNNLKNHYKKSTRCMKDRETIARDQKQSDDDNTAKTFVTEELIIKGEQKDAEDCSPS